MATEVDLTYLGRLFINQYVFKLDVRLQRLYCSADTAIAAGKVGSIGREMNLG